MHIKLVTYPQELFEVTLKHMPGTIYPRFAMPWEQKELQNNFKLYSLITLLVERLVSLLGN